jgi:hypothetical protein
MLRIALAGLGDLAQIERTWTIRQVMDLNEILDAKEEGEEQYYRELNKPRKGKR